MEEWKLRDPIPALAARLREQGVLPDVAVEALEAEVAKEIEDAVAFAESSDWEPLAELERFVYAEGVAP